MTTQRKTTTENKMTTTTATKAKTTTATKENKMTTTATKVKPATKTTATKENKMTKVEWKLVNAPQKFPNESLTELEYVCKYKGETFMLINKHYFNDRCKWVELYIVKNYVKTYITTIFSFIYDNSSYANRVVDFDGIKIQFNQYGSARSEALPWTEIQEKAIKYIDAISND
jgi:hypothetical protein